MPTNLPKKKPLSDGDKRRQFQSELVSWYKRAGRNLPWRQTRDPYAIIVSEVMLQQTQVSRGLPKFLAWMKQFPTLEAVANAPLSEVLAVWQGLGYNRRAKYLWLMAKTVVNEYNGIFPHSKEEILKLPGVGPHTAGAIMSFAFGALEPIYDTNALRVVGRVFKGYRTLPSLDQKQWKQLMQNTVPAKQKIYAFNQALMDLGALVCTAKQPSCSVCPISSICRSYPSILSASAQDLRLTKPVRETVYFGQPRRIWRGKILRVLHELAPRRLTWQQLGQHIQTDFSAARLPWLKSVVKLLEQEGMLRVKENRIGLL